MKRGRSTFLVRPEKCCVPFSSPPFSDLQARTLVATAKSGRRDDLPHARGPLFMGSAMKADHDVRADEEE